MNSNLSVADQASRRFSNMHRKLRNSKCLNCEHGATLDRKTWHGEAHGKEAAIRNDSLGSMLEAGQSLDDFYDFCPHLLEY